MKYELTAVVPTGQYANIQPRVELEGDDLNALHEEAMAHIARVFRENGVVPLTQNKMGGKVVETFTGEKVIYDDVAHKYTDMQGNELISGSTYAKRFTKDFDKEAMIPRCAKAWGVSEEAVRTIWELNGKISTEHGSSLHTALELYHRFHKEGAIIQQNKKGAGDANYCLPKNVYIRDAVLSFVEKFGTDALSEVFVSDVKNKLVGQIDRLAIIDGDKKIARVGDYKTNNEMDDDKMLGYQHQLSFYANILRAHGWTVPGLDLYHYTEKGWEHTELPVLDLVA